MSFESRQTSILIGSGTLLTGSLTKVQEEPEITNEGWDTLTVTYYQRRASCTAEEVAALFPLGGRLGGRNWWIAGVKPTEVAPQFWKFLVSYKGWGTAKPAVIRVGSSANQQSASNILAPRYVGDTVGAVYAKLETHEATPTVAVTYLVANIISDSLTDKVGTALTPGVSGIDVPATVWGMLTEYVWHWPQGWVLMGSDQDRLPGTSAALVTDNYKYIRAKTPG